jgi:hypothetical protein
LHKSGPRNLLDNYRPISILPAISKVFEKTLYRQLFNHLNANNLISKFQFGFRPLHSTADALLHSTNEWYSNVDHGLFNIAVFWDLKKAFDTVIHDILTKKLGFYSFDSSAVNLLSSYLTNRSQMCCIDEHFSSPSEINYGIPKGPLLFLIYENDFLNCVEKSNIRKFADEITLTACFWQVNNRLNLKLIAT